MIAKKTIHARISPKRSRDPIRHIKVEELLPQDPTAIFGGPPLQQLNVEGLLSFNKKTSFTFGQLNILVGPNGSGKSNLIDCIRILRYAPVDIQEAFRDSGFEEWLNKGSEKKTGSGLVEVILKVEGVENLICHQLRLGPAVNSRAPLEELVEKNIAENEPRREPYFLGSPRSQAVLSFSDVGKRRQRRRELSATEYNPYRSILSQIRDAGQYPEITRLARLYSGFRIYSEWTFGRSSKLREATPAGRSDATLSESMDDLALALNALEQTEAHEKIQILLQDLKETYRDYVTRVLFGRVGLELVETPFALPVPAKRLSDGTLRFLALAAILLQPNPPPLICIEEPELGMHPDMIKMVAKMIVDASSGTQLIISTHSEYLLTALQDDFDALFTFNAGVTGSVVRRFSQEEYKNWRQEHTLGELWTSGELGGNRW